MADALGSTSRSASPGSRPISRPGPRRPSTTISWSAYSPRGGIPGRDGPADGEWRRTRRDVVHGRPLPRRPRDRSRDAGRRSVQVSVEAATAALDPKSWDVVVAEQRPRATAGRRRRRDPRAPRVVTAVAGHVGKARTIDRPTPWRFATARGRAEVHPRNHEARMKRIDSVIPIAEDAHRLIFRARVVSVAAFALAMTIASWIGSGRREPTPPPTMLAWCPDVPLAR
jgi:hypothetical protein